MSESTSNLKEFLPYGGAILITLGLIKVFTFYNAFQIVVTDYLELTEILVLFIDSLFAYAVGISLLLVLSITMVDDFLKNRTVNFEKIYSEKIWLFRILKYFAYTPLVFAVSLYLVGKSIYNIHYTDAHDHKELTHIYLIATLYGVFIIVHELSRIVRTSSGREMSTSTLCLAYLSIAAPILVILLSWEEATMVKENKGTWDLELTYSDRTIKSSDSVYYIGKTKSYFFFHNERLGQTLVYPNTDIKAIKQTKRPISEDVHSVHSLEQ